MSVRGGRSTVKEQKKLSADELAEEQIIIHPKTIRCACGHLSKNVHTSGNCQACAIGSDCAFCDRKAVGACSWGYHGAVCEWHYLVAGANGLLPIKFNTTDPLMPRHAAAIVKRIRE